MAEIDLKAFDDSSMNTHGDNNSLDDGDELFLFPEFNPFPVMRLSIDLNWITGNPAAVELFKSSDATKEQIVSVFPFLLEFDIYSLVNNNETKQVETPVRDKFYNISLRGMSDHQCIHLYANDITARKSLEKRILHLKKMESMGTISAGVAHELNSPIQFIGDNNEFIRESVEELLQHLVNLKEKINSVHSLEELEKFKTEILPKDFHYLKDELSEALSDSTIGIGKISKIIKAMKAFSHPGDSIMHRVNINQLIEDSVTISNSQWKYECDVTLHLDPVIPEVMGMPDELNQAFLNLIVNSAQAIKNYNQKFDREMGEITISSKLINSTVEIEFIDNGIGIPSQIIDKIYDPFFTTKEIGEGTGQGLSFVYGIITNRHKGSIQVESTQNEYTKFTIFLEAS